MTDAAAVAAKVCCSHAGAVLLGKLPPAQRTIARPASRVSHTAFPTPRPALPPDRAVLQLMSSALAQPGCERMRIVLVPSTRDLTGLFTFPQAAFSSGLLGSIQDESVRSVSSKAHCSRPARQSPAGVASSTVAA